MGGSVLENTMENRWEKVNGNAPVENGFHSPRPNSYQPVVHKVSLAWLDLRVFYVRISKCEVDNDSTPEYLTLNHVPLNRNTLVEVNGARISIHSNSVSTLLRRDRLDKKSEEVTFVSTDSLRTTGSVKFEVLNKDVLVVSGVLDLCHSDKWKMDCETDGNGFLQGKMSLGMEPNPSSIEVCVAGSFVGNPIILTKNLQVSCRKKQTRKVLLETIPENEATAEEKQVSSGLPLQVADYSNYEPEHEQFTSLYSGMEYMEGEDGELSWFNAGVRVGVGIGLSICLGLGIGVGLLVRTYSGATRNFRRRLL